MIKCQIKDLCITSSGGTPNRSNKHFFEGSIPWFTTSELNKKYLSDSLEHITNDALLNSSAKIFKKGSILLAMYGASIGKISIITNNAASNQACCSIMPLKNIHNEYLYYILLSNKQNLVELGCGAGQPNISQNIIKNFELTINSNIVEQQKIAEALSDVDGLIENLEKLIEKKKQIKLGTMQDLLTGKKRLPGFTEEWEQIQLKDILYYEQPTDYIVSNTEYKNIGIPVLTPGKTFVLGYTNETNNIYENLPVILFDDFLTVSRFVDFKFKVKSSAVKLLNVKNPKLYNLRMVYNLIQMLKFNVVDHQRHWISQFSKLIIEIPKKQEQDYIIKILSDMENEIENLKQELYKFKQLKQGMMEQLLTGRIRLVNEKFIENPVVNINHNHVFDDAIVFANIVASCYNPSYPLGRKKCQKMMYLFKRFNDESVEQFGHYAAGPYDNKARYGGFESVAVKNNYVIENRSTNGSSFAPGKNIEKAKAYCVKYGYNRFIPIFNEYLKYKKVDELELYTTVDKTILELKQKNIEVNLNTVKDYIANDKTWVPKLSKEIFSDNNILAAINFSLNILGE